MRGIHRWPVNSPHKGPVTSNRVTRKMFPFDDIMGEVNFLQNSHKATPYLQPCVQDTYLWFGLCMNVLVLTRTLLKPNLTAMIEIYIITHSVCDLVTGKRRDFDLVYEASSIHTRIPPQRICLPLAIFDEFLIIRSQQNCADASIAEHSCDAHFFCSRIEITNWHFHRIRIMMDE